MTVDSDLRASLVAASLAAALSLAVGAISGVAFLAILLRAFLGGAVFGGLAYGAILLARSALPGLERGGDGLPGYDDAAPGGRVNIVLPGEGPGDPAVYAGDDPLSGMDAGRETGAFAPLEGEPDGAAGREEPVLEELVAPTAGEEEPEHPARTPPSAASPSPATADRARPTAAFAAAEAPDAGSLMDGGEGLLPSEGAALPPALSLPRGNSLDDLDVLPDLEGFSDSFSAPEYREAGAEPGASHSRKASSGARGTEGMDPAALAQAVRTILKRDQKG